MFGGPARAAAHTLACPPGQTTHFTRQTRLKVTAVIIVGQGPCHSGVLDPQSLIARRRHVTRHPGGRPDGIRKAARSAARVSQPGPFGKKGSSISPNGPWYYGLSPCISSGARVAGGILLTQRMMTSPEPTELVTDFWAAAYAAIDA
jgi:hypothetical protein